MIHLAFLMMQIVRHKENHKTTNKTGKSAKLNTDEQRVLNPWKALDHYNFLFKFPELFYLFLMYL